jgi:hypothetical protein
MGYTETPARASSEELVDICDSLLDGDLSVDEISDETGYGERKVKQNITYGISLGFIEEDENGQTEVSDLGIEAVFNKRGDNPLSEEFRKGIMNYPFCRDALSELASNHAEEETFYKTDVEKVFRKEFDIDSNTSRKIATFLEALEYAGLGDYIQGRGKGDKETRLELNEEFQNIYDEMFADKDEGQEEPSDISSNEEQQSQQSEPPRQQPISHQLLPQKTEQGVSFDISLELSGEEDPKQVEELVASVRRGMNRSVNENKGQTEESITREETTQEPDETEETSETENGGSEEPERSEEGNGESEEKESEDVESEVPEEDSSKEEEAEEVEDHGEKAESESTSSLSEF